MSAEIKPTEDLLLVFDAGTQSMRCALMDVTGKMVDFIKIPIQPYFSPQPDFAEQHPEYFWENLCQASQQILSRNINMVKKVKAVALTSHRGTYINLDANGNPLRPAITWLDRRSIAPTRWAPFHLEVAFKIGGVYNYLDSLYRHCFSNWIQQNQPEIWDKTDKYVLLSAYLHFRLTGNVVESLGSNYGYIPINRRTYHWAEKGDLIRILFPIEDSKFPALVAQGEKVGLITEKACRETGIPAGLPVLATACDKSCEVLGAGCLTDEIPSLSFGTLATIDTMTDTYLEVKPYLTPYPAAVPGHYIHELPVVRGFWMVRWFLDEFGMKEQLQAKEKNVAPESLLDELIADIPPGSQGLVLQPYWNPFRINCGDEGRGSIIGFSDLHSRAHLYKAILEGLIFALKDGADMTTARLKHPFKKLRVSGGGAQSSAALQITADVFNLPVECPSISETSIVGAAINAAVGMGYYPDYTSAVNGMTRIDRVFQPILKNSEIYSHLYHRVYKKMYRRMEPLFKDIHDIAQIYPDMM